MQIKRFMILCMTTILAISVTGCSSKIMDNTSVQTEQVQSEETASASSDIKEDVSESHETQDAAGSTNGENDILIIYFSSANMNDVDAVTSATPLIDGVSSVGWIANVIQESTGADIARIIPVEDYPLEYNDVADAAKKEADNEVHPDIQALDVDPTSYKTIFVGYPIWWYRMPMVMEAFLDTYDLSGITIIPFNTHEGSRSSGTYDMIREREPEANVVEGLAIRGRNVGSDESRADVEDWLSGLDLGENID